MLRDVLTALGLLLLICSAVAATLGQFVPALWLLINGSVLTAGIVWERWRYRATERSAPGVGWQRTGERFIDPETGKLTEVYYEPASGERRYVARE